MGRSRNYQLDEHSEHPFKAAHDGNFQPNTLEELEYLRKRKEFCKNSPLHEWPPGFQERLVKLEAMFPTEAKFDRIQIPKDNLADDCL